MPKLVISAIHYKMTDGLILSMHRKDSLEKKMACMHVKLTRANISIQKKLVFGTLSTQKKVFFTSSV